MWLKNLGVIMAHKKITGNRLSEETGITISTLSRHKNGKAVGIDFETLEKLIKCLECTPDELFGVVPYTVKRD